MPSIAILQYSSIRLVVSDYMALTKPKVVALLLLTAWVGMALAPDTNNSLLNQIGAIIGIGLMAASAAAINHLVDQQIDTKMARTRNRPVATGRINTLNALIFALVLAIIGVGLILVCANELCAWLTFFALIGYAAIYTMFLKRATPQNIVIGGLAGAMPPLLGWVAETGTMAAQPWLLVMIIFTWTPPHFWALAIARHKDYSEAKIPMLPVTHGIPFCKLSILLYSVILTLVCFLPYLIEMSGAIYLVATTALNTIFLAKAWALYKDDSDHTAMPLFRFSIIHLMVLFIALLADKWLLM